MTEEKKYISQVNSHVEDYLDYYCKLSHSPEFAVLLKGEWGCGKTWFIKKYCEKLEKNKREEVSDEVTDKGYLYVSLNGVASLNDIGTKFLLQSLPSQFSSKGMAVIGNFAKEWVKSKSRFDSDSLINSIADFFNKNSQAVLIFDDLERCKVDISELFGYINEYIEHQQRKVIILAKEDKLFGTDNYQDIKEKLIGQTFEIGFDLHSALENFIEKVDNSEIKNIFKENAKLIEEIYQTADYRNLRILNRIVLAFERIFRELPDKAKDKAELLQDILKILTAFYIEINCGNNFIPKDIGKLENLGKDALKAERQRQFDQATSQKDSMSADISEEPATLRSKIEKYTKFNIYLSTPFLGISWWQNFFDKDIISEDFQESILNSRYFIDENMPNWAKLWHFCDTDLSDEDFDKLLKEVESEYARREFIYLEEVKHVTGILLNVSNLGYYSRSKENILHDAKKYIDDLIEDNKLDLNPIIHPLDQIIDNTYRGLKFQGLELEEFKKFLDYIETAKNSAIEAMLTELGLELLEIMQKDVLQFYRMICVNESYSSSGNTVSTNHIVYSNVPILKTIDPKLFMDKFLSMRFENQKTCFFAIKEGYEYIKGNENLTELIEEISWLKSVQELLLSEIEIRKNKPSGYRLNTLNIRLLNEVIESLEKSKIQ